MRFKALAIIIIMAGLAAGCVTTGDLGTIPADRLDCAVGLTQLYQQVRPGIVKIVILSAGGQKLGSGSGFFISSDGTLVTNYHVIANAGQAQVLADEGRTWNVQGVSAMDKHVDLAVIKVDAANVPYLPLVRSQSIRVGQRVAALGNPLGMEGIISAGALSGRDDAPWSGEWIRFTAQVTGGYSGSPLLDECGRVIGVVSRRAEDKPDENFAAPSEAIFQLLSKAATSLSALPAAGTQVVRLANEDRDYGMARIAYANKKYAVAAGLFKKLAERYPNDADISILWGISLQAGGQKKEAISVFDETIRTDPAFAAAYRCRGLAYFDSDQPEKAVEDFDKALQLNPDYVAVYAYRGLAYDRMGRKTQAMNDFDQAIRMSPDHAETYLARATVNAKTGRHQEVIQDLSQAIRLDPDRAAPYSLRGVSYILAGEPQKGCADLQEACRLGDCKALNERKKSGACQ